MKRPFLIIGILVLGIIGASVWYVTAILPERRGSDSQTTSETPPLSETATSAPSSETTYQGKILAGSLSPLVEFNQADYDAAVKSDKLIVLYFYANWCPTCKEEQPHLFDTFDSLNSDRVIGFRVNYKDDFTDADEVGVARDHGVAYQHTKVFIQSGKEVLKSPEPWTKDRYLKEINDQLGSP